MSAGEWIGLARLVVSVIGFGVAIRQLARIANASQAGLEQRRAQPEEAGSLPGGSASPGDGARYDAAGVA